MTTTDWIFEPDDFLRYFRSTHTPAESSIRLPRRVVLVFGRTSFEAYRRTLGARRLEWNPRIAVGRAGSRAIAVVRSTIGSPAATIELEEAIALGARTVVAFGSCGSLTDGLQIGQVVLPTAALSDEGTSRHYGGARWTHPDSALVGKLRASCRRRSIPIREGAVWTTDAVYRESRSVARRLVRQGVLGVEMEASALFTVGALRGVQVASLFVVSDVFSREVWTPGFGSPAFRRGVGKAIRAVVDVLSGSVR